jgi:Protein of unknown function (DUF3016)
MTLRLRKEQQQPPQGRPQRVHHPAFSVCLLKEPRMNTTARKWFVAGALAAQAVAAQAAGTIELKWVEPEKFADIGFSAVDREMALQALGEHINRLSRQLPDGQTLKIEVTDLNLAGEMHPDRARDLRVLRGRADWPTMELRYTLQADGRTLKSGQARLADMNYQFTARNDPYGYEKRMIDTWFRTEFKIGG